MLPAIDLHSHTTASDGGLSPTALVEMAAAKGLQYLAITDHDTCAGLAEARLAAKQQGVGLIAGIELSSVWNDCGIHVVGLGIDDAHPAIVDAVVQQTQARMQRSLDIDAQLRQRGFTGVIEQARLYASSDALGRPHFAKAMVELGYVESEPEAFKRYLGSGRPGDIRSHWPSLATVIGWINAAGGIAVVAHPLKYDLNWTRLQLMLKDFVAAGGGAMEVSYGGENPNRVIDLTRIARQHKLKMSVGSDFHRVEFHWTALGKYPPIKGEFDPVWHDLDIELDEWS
jgi:predicted metal-dependent phosphoesterase TrpH